MFSSVVSFTQRVYEGVSISQSWFDVFNNSNPQSRFFTDVLKATHILSLNFETNYGNVCLPSLKWFQNVYFLWPLLSLSLLIQYLLIYFRGKCTDPWGVKDALPVMCLELIAQRMLIMSVYFNSKSILSLFRKISSFAGKFLFLMQPRCKTDIKF